MRRDISRGVLAVLWGAVFLFLLLAAVSPRVSRSVRSRDIPVVGEIIGQVRLNSLDNAVLIDLPGEGRHCLLFRAGGVSCWEVAPR